MFSKLAAILFLSITALIGCEAVPEASRDELINIGTHSLFIHCTGAGKPTIVIDTGLGETYESWEPLIEQLNRENRVCAYNRAGYGESEPGPMPRDSQRAADELHQLLANAGEDGPILLVGHSLGGINMQIYANSYPEKVVGLVLLDPPPLAWMAGEGFPELRELFSKEMMALREAADAASVSADPDVRVNAAYLNAIASENEEFFGRTAEEVTAIRSFGDLPLTTIGATEPDPRFGEYAQAFRQFWNEESQRLAGKSESGKFVLAEGSSHHIHLDAPQVVVDAVLEMAQ